MSNAPEPATVTQGARFCDCERSHNGLGMAGRVCDCEEVPASSTGHDALICAMIGTLWRLADIAKTYADYIQTVPASEIERHPYLPSIEAEIDDARTLIRRYQEAGAA